MEKSASFLEMTEEDGKKQIMEGLYVFIETRDSSLRALIWPLLRLSIILSTEKSGAFLFIH